MEEKKLTIRLDEELFRAIKAKCAHEGLSLTDVGAMLWSDWLRGERKAESAPIAEYAGPNAEAHRALDQILSLPSGDVLRETIDAALTIQRNKDGLSSYPSTHNLRQVPGHLRGIYKSDDDKR